MDLLDWLSPDHIVSSGGSWALGIVAAILFAECGLLIGVLFPGDTLLFTAGVLTATGLMAQPIWLTCLVLSAAAVLGNLVGFEIGHRLGDLLLRGKRSSMSRLIQPRQVVRTERFFDRYGALAIVLARFVGVVRTLITVVAGAAGMNRVRYLTYSTVGGILWVCTLTLLGYFLGQFPVVQQHVRPHLDLIILGAVGCSVAAVVGHLLLDRRRAGIAVTSPGQPAADKTS